MKKACNLKVGEMAIYIVEDDIVKISKVVPKPIDNNYVRPAFKIGRIDLANGSYLIGDSTVYDSVEEAEKTLIEKLENDIKRYEAEKIFLEAKLISAKKKLKKLNGHVAE